MTLQDLAQLVLKMRNAQRKYFKDRTNTALTESKLLEAQVDEAVARIIHNHPKQGLIDF